MTQAARPVFEKPPYRGPWWETPIFWPADIAGGIGRLLRYRVGTWWLYQRLSGAAFRVLERFDPEGRQIGRACPCTFTPESEHFYFEEPDPDCDVCFGSGSIWLDRAGNVIGNAEAA